MSQAMIPHSRPTLGAEEIKAASAVIGSGHIAQGSKVQEFEEALADFLGVRGVTAVNSGTSALHLGLMASGLSREDEVIVPSFVCTAPLNAVYQAGAFPSICDIEEESFNISHENILETRNEKTKAVIVPHMFGSPADIEKIVSSGVHVIEDCAHALGAVYGDKKAGSFGRFGILSFYANKMMACGEGGAIVSNNVDIIGFARDRRDYDERGDYRLRYNYKMTDIQAAIGLEQLKKLPGFIGRRKELAAKYDSSFRGYGAVLPRGEFDHIYYRYVIRIKKDVQAVMAGLAEKGIKCAKPVHTPLHRVLEMRSGFQVSDRAYSCALSIPIYPSLTDEEQDRVIAAVREALS